MRGIERLDRRHGMIGSRIIDQRRVERIRQGEASEQAPVIDSVDVGRAADDVAASDQEDQYIVHAIPVQPLGGGASLLTGPRIDAELVTLDMPGRGAGCQAVKQRAAEAENGPHARQIANLGQYRLEPALDAAMERVVIEGLVMRPMRLSYDRAIRCGRVDGMASLTISALVGHVRVELQVVPTRGEVIPVRQRT